MQKLEWTTEKRRVNDLLKLDINPRKITEAKKQELKASIEKFNLVDIPVIDKDDVIISGNQRVFILQVLERGDEYIDVRVPNRKLTKKEKKEYAIIGNIHAGEFDFDILQLEFEDINFEEIGFDIGKIEFTESKIFEKALEKYERQNSILEVKEDDYEIPEQIKTDIVIGDLFQIGQHRLLCGDSTNSDQVEKLLKGDKAKTTITDPPYNVKFIGRKNKNGFRHEIILNDNLNDEDFLNFIKSFMDVLINNETEYVYIFCDYKMSIILSSLYKFKQCLVVIKSNFGMGNGYRKQTELCLYKGNYKGTDKGDILLFSSEMTFNEKYRVPVKQSLHPTQKPVKLISELIIDSTLENEIIIDYFLGSGTSMVSSHQLNRKCYGMELDPKYCQVIIDRMKKLDPSIIIKKNGQIIYN